MSMPPIFQKKTPTATQAPPPPSAPAAKPTTAKPPAPAKPAIDPAIDRRKRIVDDIELHSGELLNMMADPDQFLKVMEAWNELPPWDEKTMPEYKNTLDKWEDNPLAMRGDYFAARFLMACRKAKVIE